MNLDTAETAIAEPPSDLALAGPCTAHGAPHPVFAGEAGHAPADPSAWGWADARVDLAAARADPARAAVRDVWLALWSSRLVVWVAGMGAVAAFGLGPARHAFDPPGLTHGLGRLGDLLAAPAARWDAAWYLVIAHYGYRPDLGAFTAARAAFFPLYPLGVRTLAGIGLAPVLAGVALSIAALAAALYALHRLVTLEGGRDARLVVLLTAAGPMAFYFSAVYSESLFLALSVGVFLCARRGQWALASALAGLAGATRSTGLVLMVPLALLYLYGPRQDRPPDRSGEPPPGAPRRLLGPLANVGAVLRRPFGGLHPRYRLRADALWLMLAPAGLALYMGCLALSGGDALSPLGAQAEWGRHFAGPFVGVWDGARAALAGARQLVSMQRTHLYFPAAGGSPFIDAGHNLMLFAFLLAAVPALVGVARRMPIAYGAYVLAALALPLSCPVAPQPLMSLPRFLAVLFPLNMWMGEWLAGRTAPRARAVALAGSAAAMAFFAAEFATWHWVA